MTLDVSTAAPRTHIAAARAATNPWLWFALGGVLSFFAVGGRMDIALTAWIAPVLLLRFSRRTAVPAAIAAMIVLSFANAVWALQLMTPITASTLAFSVMLGVVYALPYVLDRLLSARGRMLASLFVFPTAMVVAEFAIAMLSPLGASYGLRAITQSDQLALLQLISITGPYGIAFLVGWLATALNALWDDLSWAGARRHVLPVALALILAVAGGQLRLLLAAPPLGAAHVRIAGLTPPIALRNAANAPLTGAAFPPSDEAKARTRTPEIQATYAEVQAAMLDATSKAAQAGADIVLWSETAAPTLADGIPGLMDKVSALAKQEGVYINATIGVPFELNETRLAGPDGQILWTYRKNHPVPGMEPVAPASTPVPVVETRFGRLANVICYDADFPSLTRVAADIMFVPGWDWPEVGYIHTMKMARLRAIENGYSLIRPDFIGQSGAFDYLGNVLAAHDTTAAGDGHALFVDMPVQGVRTLYGMIGDTFAWLCLAALLGLSALALAGARGRSLTSPGLRSAS